MKNRLKYFYFNFSFRHSLPESGTTMVVIRLFYVLVVLVLCQVTCEAATQHCSDKGEASIFGMMLRRHIFKKITGATLGDVCLWECYRDVRCQSFNYVFTQDMCELSSRTKEARPEDFVPSLKRYYFRRDKNRGEFSTRNH